MPGDSAAAPRRIPGRVADLAALGGLTVAWWSAVALADPRGDFPLNDDWGYAPAVRALVEDGALRFTEWQSMPLVTHVLWGALFAKVAGTSHEALRASTLVMGWLGVLAVYGLLRQVRAPARVASVSAALVLANPIYFALAHTFMTDVPFVAALTAATAAWIRAEDTGRARWLVAAVGLCLWAVLNRQLGIALPLTWTVVSALRHGIGRRWLLTALGPAVLVIGGLFLYERVIEATLGLPLLYHRKGEELMEALTDLTRLRGLRFPLVRSTWAPLYLGLFCGPLIALLWPSLEQHFLVRFFPVLGGASAALAAGLDAGLPLTGNVWIDLGIGPRSAPGVVAGTSDKLWIILTTAAGVGAGFLFVALHAGAWRAGVLGAAGSWRGWPRRVFAGLRSRATPDEPGGAVPAWAWLLVLGTALVAFAPTSLVYGAWFDRYLLTQLPFVPVSLWAAADRREGAEPISTAIGAAALALFAAFSVAGTHDYLAWQRARWEGVARLEARGVPREDIRGGFEVDNHPPPPEGTTLASRPKAPWAVAIAPLHGHRVVERIPVDAWLPNAVDEILLLRRSPKPSTSGESEIRR
ncbi:MAG TPA: glycosyltransferase family 39 protein [Sandaracinaceae bacterium LLY-WYZ-13_1]|nr:glycosyltransferase family 39 protein [Sandaracinaceae bacterium LLY-WYZ-13_1]